MVLSQLRIQALRNIQAMELAPGPGINIVCGPNGAGKTTLLEAIYLLGRGRSFRDQQTDPLIHLGDERFTVFGRLTDAAGGVHSIGIEKGLDAMKARIDGQDIRRLSLLARTLPIQILTPRTHEILERGPAYRRRFIDWGVFHVEHRFSEISARYLRAVAQRNAALRKQPKAAFAWDEELAEQGERIDAMRQGYVSGLQAAVEEVAADLMPDRKIGLAYRSGWPRDRSLLQRIDQTRDEDTRRGYTGNGPHRADLVVELDGRAVEKIASRGEQKLVIASLYLAQAAMGAEKTGIRAILLIDDLPAELDRTNRNAFLKKLCSLGNQAIITGTEADFAESVIGKTVFHVERGQLK